MQSKATTVEQYLAELPADRRAVLSAVREHIRAHIDPGFSEGVGYGMIGWAVPHSRYPAGYHCNPKQPLPFAGLASQKHYLSLYICPPSMSAPSAAADAEADWFRSAWAKTGKKLDMGKGCIRFRKLDDLALDVIAESFRRMTVDRFVAEYEAARAAYQPKSRAEIQAMMAERKAAKKAPAKKAAAKKVAVKKAVAKKTAVKTSAAKKAPAKKTARAAR